MVAPGSFGGSLAHSQGACRRAAELGRVRLGAHRVLLAALLYLHMNHDRVGVADGLENGAERLVLAVDVADIRQFAEVVLARLERQHGLVVHVVWTPRASTTARLRLDSTTP